MSHSPSAAGAIFPSSIAPAVENRLSTRPSTERRRRDVCTTHCASCGTESPPSPLCGGASESATAHTAQAWVFPYPTRTFPGLLFAAFIPSAAIHLTPCKIKFLVSILFQLRFNLLYRWQRTLELVGYKFCHLKFGNTDRL